MNSLFIPIQVPTLIAEGSLLHGEFIFRSAAEVHGQIEGNLRQESLEKLCIGATGWIRGSIVAKGPVYIEGRVEGDVISSVKIRLSASACVHGSLISPCVDVRPGALFEGETKMKTTGALTLIPSKRAA